MGKIMNKFLKFAALAASLGLASVTTAQAGIISVSAGLSSDDIGPNHIAAPGNITDDAAYNGAIQGFNEMQSYSLLADLAVDGGTIASGTTVSSHMLFLNSGAGNDTRLIEHGAGGNKNSEVTFGFDGMILGVMSDRNGALELASSLFLGAVGTLYPDATQGARGMEGNDFTNKNNDWYIFSGDTISLGMRVTEPGDWIRVITAAVPVPPSLALMALGLLGLVGSRRLKS
jgi:hypothetical protein